MIKARATLPDGSALLILGLEGENMARLMSDEPILITADQIHELLGELAVPTSPRFQIAIIGGADAAAITAQLDRHIGPDTIVHGP